MHRSFALVALLTVGVTAGALLGRSGPSASAAPEPVTVAVVDFLRCLKAHPGYLKAITKFQDAEKAASAARDATIEDIKKQQAAIKLEPADAPGILDRQKNLEKRANGMKFDYEWAAKVAADEYLRSLSSIYDAVRAAVANHARANRIGLVLQMTEEKLQAKSPDEFTANVIVRNVLHFEPTLDITQAILATFPASPPPVPAPK